MNTFENCVKIKGDKLPFRVASLPLGNRASLPSTSLWGWGPQVCKVSDDKCKCIEYGSRRIVLEFHTLQERKMRRDMVTSFRFPTGLADVNRPIHLNI